MGMTEPLPLPVAVEAPKAKDAHIVAHNVFVLLTRYVALWALNGALVLFQPKYLGDTGLGQFYFATSFVSLFSIGVALGVRHFLIKEVARSRSKAQQYLGAAMGLRIISSLLVLAIIMVSARIMHQTDSTAGKVIFIASLWMIASAFAQLMAAVIHGEENMTWAAMAEVVNKIVVVVAGIIVLVLGMGVLAYAIVTLAGATVNFVLNASYVYKHFPLKVNLHFPTVKALVIGGAPYMLIGFLSTAYSYMDVVMLRFFTNDAEVGWYAAALQLYKSLEYFPVALTTALLPTLARIHFTNARALIRISQKAITLTLLVIVPVSLGVSLFAEEVITMLPYPDSFRNSIPLLHILTLSIPITALLTLLGTIAIAVDRQRIWSIAMLGTLLLNAGSNAILIPYFSRVSDNGAIGASLATVISESFMVLVSVWLMPKGVVSREMLSMVSKVALAGGALLAVGEGAKHFELGMIPVAALAALTYGALILATRAVTMADIRFVREIALDRLKGARRTREQEGSLLP